MSSRREDHPELLASHDDIGMVVDHLPQLAWMADEAGSIFWYSRRWFDYTGTTLEDMRGWGWQKVHHPDHVERVVAKITHSFETGNDWEDTFPLRAKDDSYRWFLSRARPIRDKEGRIVRWFGSNTDITELRIAESSLRDSEEFNRRILASSPDCIEVLDLDGSLRFISDGGMHLMEIDDFRTFEGRNWLEFWDAPHLKDAQAAVTAALSGQTGRFEGAAPTAKGSPRWWDVRVSPINGSDGKPERLLSISRDITSEHLASQHIRELNLNLERRVDERTTELVQSRDLLLEQIDQRERAEEKIRQMQKNEAIGQLTGGIAHDFNNMLAVIIGGLSLAERRLARGENSDALLKGALDAANRAATLTNRLLAFSRQLPLAPVPIDANRLISSMSELLRRTLGETIVLETVLSGGLWTTHADLSQLENVLLNLGINARDAMPEGGKLTIETANAYLDDEYARAHVEIAAGQYVMIAVSDTGCGMTPDVVSRALEPYFTTKPLGRGTGLGLSQVYGFVRQSRGHVKIYSELQKGTAVKIYLPRMHASAEAAHAATEQARAAMPRGLRSEVILVVEDEPRILEMTTQALRELGYSVLHAGSAKAALPMLERHPEIGLLFTDVVMPDMNGRQLADRAVIIRPGLRVLYTTGYTRNAVVHNGVLDPGVNLLAKPFTIDQLAQKVREVLS